MQAGNIESNPSSMNPALTLMSLPAELHLLISQNLSYPDALSLKHTNRHFNHLVYTGIHLKIEWLLERRSLHLDCPNDRSCELGTDMRFCRGSVAYDFPFLLFYRSIGPPFTDWKILLGY